MDHSVPVRWGSLDELLKRYPIGKTRAYDLLKSQRLRAKKLGGRTIWDFQSADELFDSLPDYGEGS